MCVKLARSAGGGSSPPVPHFLVQVCLGQSQKDESAGGLETITLVEVSIRNLEKSFHSNFAFDCVEIV